MTILPINYQFEASHACVLFTVDKDANTVERPKLYIQCLDAYGRQLELSIQYRHEPGDMKKLFWELHAYRHPGIREICKLTAKMGEDMIKRIIDLCERFPGLLFNESAFRNGTYYPNCHGFVLMHTQLLDGHKPSLDLLP